MSRIHGQDTMQSFFTRWPWWAAAMLVPINRVSQILEFRRLRPLQGIEGCTVSRILASASVDKNNRPWGIFYSGLGCSGDDLGNGLKKGQTNFLGDLIFRDALWLDLLISSTCFILTSSILIWQRKGKVIKSRDTRVLTNRNETQPHCIKTSTLYSLTL